MDGLKVTANVFARIAARSVGQVMFQSNVLSGFLMACAIVAGGFGIGGSGRFIVTAGATVAILISSAIAVAATLPDGRDGVWGFNAVLVGCAVFTFNNSGAGAWAMLCAGVLLTFPLKGILDRMLGVASLTLPFVISTWIITAIGHATGLMTPWIPETIPSAPEQLSATSIAIGLLKVISEVFLIDSWVAGLLMLAGLLAGSPRCAVLALSGSAAGMVMAIICGLPAGEISAGLWGFSPALTAIAVGSVLPGIPHRGLLTTAAVILTFAIQYLTAPWLAKAGLPVLTMPFCAATLAVSLLSVRNARSITK